MQSRTIIFSLCRSSPWFRSKWRSNAAVEFRSKLRSMPLPTSLFSSVTHAYYALETATPPNPSAPLTHDTTCSNAVKIGTCLVMAGFASQVLRPPLWKNVTPSIVQVPTVECSGRWMACRVPFSQQRLEWLSLHQQTVSHQTFLNGHRESSFAVWLCQSVCDRRCACCWAAPSCAARFEKFDLKKVACALRCRFLSV